MGVHYQLENNELALCLECGLLVETGEEGCIEYTQAGLLELATRQLDEKLLELFLLAYQLQHYQYYELKEATAVSFLLTLTNFIKTRKLVTYAKNKKKINAVLKENFFYLRQALSSVFIMNVLEAETAVLADEMLEQYIVDIWNCYQEFHEQLIEKI